MLKEDRSMKVITLAAACLGLVITLLNTTLASVALPTIQARLDLGVSGAQWVMNSYNLLLATMLVTGGRLGDLFGSRRTLLTGLLVFASASMLCGASPNLGVLLAGRATQGFGSALILPATLSILRNAFPDPKERARAIGLWSGASGAGVAAGPVLGGLLVDGAGWRWVFFAGLPLAVVALVLAARVRETPRPEQRSPRSLDLPGHLLLTIALSSLCYAIIEGGDLGWSSATTLSLLTITLTGMLVFLAVESRAQNPTVEPAIFRIPTFSAANVAGTMVFFGTFGLIVYFSIFFQGVQGYLAVESGLRTLPLPLALAVVAPLAGRFTGSFGARLPMSLGLAVAGAGMVLFLRLEATSGYGSVWWNFALVGAGMGLSLAPMSAAVVSSVPLERAGVASAVHNACRQLGTVLGVALLGTIIVARLDSSLRSSLAGLGVPPDARERIVEAAGRGSAGVVEAAPPGVDAGALRQAAAEAFVSGMHASFLTAGAVLLVGALITLIFVTPAPGAPRVPPVRCHERRVVGYLLTPARRSRRPKR